MTTLYKVAMYHCLVCNYGAVEVFRFGGVLGIRVNPREEFSSAIMIQRIGKHT